MYTIENTEGSFTQETLDEMNAELEAALAELDTYGEFYDSKGKAISDRIPNKYC